MKRRRVISMSERFGMRRGTEWQREIVRRIDRLSHEDHALAQCIAKSFMRLTGYVEVSIENSLQRRLTEDERKRMRLEVIGLDGFMDGDL